MSIYIIQSCSCTLTALAVDEFGRSDKQANMHESMSVRAWVPPEKDQHAPHDLESHMKCKHA